MKEEMGRNLGLVRFVIKNRTKADQIVAFGKVVIFLIFETVATSFPHRIVLYS
jgi:hypothetical protein